MTASVDSAWAFDFMRRQRSECEEIRMREYVEIWDRLIAASQDPAFCKALRAIRSALSIERQRDRVLMCLADTAYAWNPAALRAQRDALARVRELNEEISQGAKQLAQKLALREDLVNQHGVGSNDGSTFMECAGRFAIISRWGPYSRRRYADPAHFQMDLLPELEGLQHRYELEYWPGMHGLLTALSMLADEASKGPGRWYDEVSRRALESRESSARDFVRAFLQRLRNDTESSPGDGMRLSDSGMLPPNFSLAPANIAALVNAALGLFDNPVSPDNVRKIIREDKNPDN